MGSTSISTEFINKFKLLMSSDLSFANAAGSTAILNI